LTDPLQRIYFGFEKRHAQAACFSSSARHLPCAARPFICARWWNAFCAAPTLPGWPFQALSGGFCSAREYEKVSGQGRPLVDAMALRCAVADSSDWPPERNTTPGCEAGTVRFRTRTVRSATSSTPACFGLFLPETHMLALRITYSGSTLYAASAA